MRGSEGSLTWPCLVPRVHEEAEAPPVGTTQIYFFRLQSIMDSQYDYPADRYVRDFHYVGFAPYRVSKYVRPPSCDVRGGSTEAVDH